MERLAQHEMTAPLDPAYLAGLKGVVSHVTAAKNYAVVDAHNYGRYPWNNNNGFVTLSHYFSDILGVELWILDLYLESLTLRPPMLIETQTNFEQASYQFYLRLQDLLEECRHRICIRQQRHF
jgi:hypothetical protein